MNLLTIKDLKTHFFTSNGVVKAVDRVTLDIKEKQVVGLVGESGCGKTTLGLSIMRLVPPPGKIVGGTILFQGKNLLDLGSEEMRRVRGRDISMIFQDPSTYLDPVMKVADQVAETILEHKIVQKSEIRDRVIELLGIVRMPSPEKVQSYYPFQLSGGMQQRILIASAISCNPALLIADEPTTALDVSIEAQILDLMKDLIANLGTSLLLVTHNLGIVAEICDKVYVMYAGKIVEYGDVFKIFENPCHAYTKGLLASIMSPLEPKSVFVGIDGIVPNLINPPSGCRFNPRCHQTRAICKEQEPEATEVEREHTVYCWLYK